MVLTDLYDIDLQGSSSVAEVTKDARPTLVFGPMKQPEPHRAPGALAKAKPGSTQSADDPRNSLSSQPAWANNPYLCSVATLRQSFPPLSPSHTDTRQPHGFWDVGVIPTLFFHSSNLCDNCAK